MKRLAALILMLLGLVACSKNGDRILVDDGQYAPGRIVVKVSPEMSRSLESHSGSGGTVAFPLVKEFRDVVAARGVKRMNRMFAEVRERSGKYEVHIGTLNNNGTINEIASNEDRHA